MIIEVGGLPLKMRLPDAGFAGLLEAHYRHFVRQSGRAGASVEVSLDPCFQPLGASEVKVTQKNGRGLIERFDFEIAYDAQLKHWGTRQARDVGTTDTILRVIHSMLAIREGGFLLHAASLARNGRAFVFTGVSGAGKSTISECAPPDAALLSDEVSYIRPSGCGYNAYGTPFTGELARLGSGMSAPVATVNFLEKGSLNKVEPLEKSEAARRLMRNVLFFGGDGKLVRQVFASVCDFLQAVPAQRLVFQPDARVWDLFV